VTQERSSELSISAPSGPWKAKAGAKYARLPLQQPARQLRA